MEQNGGTEWWNRGLTDFSLKVYLLLCLLLQCWFLSIKTKSHSTLWVDLHFSKPAYILDLNLTVLYGIKRRILSDHHLKGKFPIFSNFNDTIRLCKIKEMSNMTSKLRFYLPVSTHRKQARCNNLKLRIRQFLSKSMISKQNGVKTEIFLLSFTLYTTLLVKSNYNHFIISKKEICFVAL